MPAIQAMRSDALALRAKEDVQEKIPSFFNSVNQALGQNIITGQDNAEQLLDARFKAANALAAQIRQKVDGQGALSEMTAGLGMKLISQALDVVLAVLSKTTTTDAAEVISDIANFMLEQQTLQFQWKAIAATYAQWTVQAGYTGHGGDITGTDTYAIGGRGALKYRDAYTPRFTDRNYYTNSTTGWGGGQSYDHYYNWGSVGSITRVGQYP